MIPVSNQYNTIIYNGGQYEWQIVNGTNTWGKENLIGGTISSALYAKFSVGNCIAASLELDMWGIESNVDVNSPIIVKFRANDGTNTSAWYTKGTFYIDVVETSQYSEVSHITAYDAMLMAETEYMASGVWVGSTTKAVLDEIVGDLSINVESATYTKISANPVAMTAAPHIGLNGTTDRQMLSAIGMLHGCNFFINYNNELQAIWPNDTIANTADVGNGVATFDAPPADTITKVIVRKEDGTVYRKPTLSDADFEALDGACLDLECPIYASQTLADNLYTLFYNKSPQAYTASEAYIDPKYTIGDGLILKDLTLVIANQTIKLNPLASSDLEVDSLSIIQSHYPRISPRERTTLYQIGQAEAAADAAAQAAATAANNANAREQLIYRSAAAGTNTMAAYTTWVIDSTGGQGNWTTTRPVYATTHPVLFVATQRQTVEQSSGTTCTCTTPVKDQTTTVIDGGHITTGTIDASQVTVSNIDASNITTGTLDSARIAANTITVSQLTDTAKAALMTSSSSKTQYYLSTSDSSATGGSWSDTVPTWSSGKYIWTRVSTTKTYADSTSSTTSTTAVYDRALTTALSTASTASSTASSASTTASNASTAASNAQSTANSAIKREQLIYNSKASGATAPTGGTVWITDTTGGQNKWTTKRPQYSSSYPVLYVATQRETMAGTVTTTTPMIDETTTVIDGGHITTGSIDAGRITVGTLSGITISGNTITGGTLTNATSSGSVRIADGSINFFKNATTTGTPFSKIKHVTDSTQGDSIEWSNSGYTKIVNTGGGQWTADFLQFALNASSPSLRFLIYNSDDRYVEVRNTDYAYINGAQLLSNKSGSGDNAAIRVSNGAASTDTAIFLKRTDTDRSLELLIGPGGKNRGLYVRDANMTGWLLYYDDTNLNINKPLKLSAALGVGYGGTGAANAATARSNLGMTTVSLWSGTLSTTATTIASAYGAYSAYIFVGKPSGGAQASMVIPKAAVTTSDVTWQLTDNTNYRTFKIRHSGTSIIITGVAGSGSVTNVYGIAGA